MRLGNRAALALIATVIAACSHPRPRTSAPRDAATHDSLLLTKNVAPGRQCAIVDPNVSLPPIATLIDTAAMPDYLAQARVAPDSGYALYSLRFDAAGKPVRARLIEATIADSLVQPLQQAIASALLDRGAAGGLAGRLRIDFAPAPQYRLGKSEYCAAEAIPQPLERTTVVTTVMVPAGAAPPRSLPVSRIKYELDISAQGTVEAVKFLTAVDAPIEGAMRESFIKQRWKPALDDALPVASHVSTVTSGVARIHPAP